MKMGDALSQLGLSEDLIANIGAAAFIGTHVLTLVKDQTIEKLPGGKNLLGFLNTLAGNYGKSKNK